MANVSTWSGVSVAVQSALGANIPITAISKANPAVCTATNTLAVGDFVVLSVQGMTQLDGRVFRVSAASGTQFTLEGEDSTNYDTFSSGTANKITYGTTLGGVTTINASGGDFDFLDATTIADTIKKNIPGTANAATYSMEAIWDVADAGLIALKAASDNKSQRAFRFAFANGQKLVFTGYVGASAVPTGSAGEIVKTPITVTAFGKATVYST